MKDQVTEQDIKNASFFNIHEISHYCGGKKQKVSKQELVNWLHEIYDDVPYQDLQIESLIKILNSGAIKIVDADHDGNYTGLYSTGGKNWPYQIDSSIDHMPYSIKMKHPIDFDTSY